MRAAFAITAAFALFAAGVAQAQAGTSTSADAQTYTLRTSARTVLTDVLVLDDKGQPVHGLPASAFRLTDNGKPQPVTSFEEHAGPPPPLPAETSSRGAVFTNSNLLHLPPVLNVLVIDIANLSLPDQMYLSYQLESFVNRLPAGTPLCVYLNAGIRGVLLQDFTADHDRLLSAVHGALPHFAAAGRERFTDAQTLHSLADDLAGLPGRKNVLWFSGGARLSLNPAGLVSTPSPDMRLVYDELEAGRIAIYPIDARGLLTNVPGTPIRSQDEEFQNTPGLNPVFAQHGLMQDVAIATGGVPFYNTDGLWQAALQVIDTGHDFYTLSYTPHDLQFDNKWHNVRVEVNGSHYHLSYRHGYFADGAHVAMPTGNRTQLLAGNRTDVIDTELRSKPIIFRAEVKPIPTGSLKPGETPPAPGQTRYAIHYFLSGSDFARKPAGKESEVVVGVGFLAMDRNGRPLLEHAKQVTYGFEEASLRAHPDSLIPVVQQLDLNRGDTYLSLLVWDAITRRVGTLTVPLQVR